MSDPSVSSDGTRRARITSSQSSSRITSPLPPVNKENARGLLDDGVYYNLACTSLHVHLLRYVCTPMTTIGTNRIRGTPPVCTRSPHCRASFRSSNIRRAYTHTHTHTHTYHIQRKSKFNNCDSGWYSNYSISIVPIYIFVRA
jgi:hypothetical protein